MYFGIIIDISILYVIDPQKGNLSEITFCHNPPVGTFALFWFQQVLGPYSYETLIFKFRFSAEDLQIGMLEEDWGRWKVTASLFLK